MLFINASANKNGTTAQFAKNLLAGHAMDQLDLVDYQLSPLGSAAPDDFETIYQAMKSADVLVIGSPMYWHTVAGPLKTLLDRLYEYVGTEDFSGKPLYFIVQGSAPSPVSLEQTSYMMSHFASLFGMNLVGTAHNLADIQKLRQTL